MFYCWFENECVKQHHFDKDDSEIAKNQKDYQKDNQNNSNPKGILTEEEAKKRNNNTIFVRRMATITKHTCSKHNTLSNISASSCSISEFTLLWFMFTSVLLSVIVLFGCLFYFCVYKNKATDMIIITSDKDNFVLIDEE